MIAAGVAVSMGLGACTGDLDLLPTDPRDLTPGQFQDDPEHYMTAVMADIYMQFATYGANGNSSVNNFDGGMSTFQRALFNLEELPTDETNWCSTGDPALHALTYGPVTSLNDALFGTWSRLMINIGLCNDFIQTVNGGYFGNDAALKAKAEDFIRQSKILRSGCYFWMIDLFGDVPYADESVTSGTLAPQLSRAEVYNRVVATLEEVSAEYTGNETPDYGYIGKDVADALLVKFYLNAEVFTGTPAWNKCFEKAKALIARHQGRGFKQSGLCNSYFQNFAYNNKDFAIGGKGNCSEILWTIPQDEVNLKSYANGTLMVNAFLGEPAVPADYNSTGAWKCATARQQLVDAFEWNDEAKSQSPDIRVSKWITSKDGVDNSEPIYTQDYWGKNGYMPLKFTNFAINDDGTDNKAASPDATDQHGIDYPVIRLAEIYLSAAEAALQGGGSTSDGLAYVNIVRERAGLTPWTSIEFNLDNLQTERQRELYLENSRRTDLIRYGKWISGYNWQWKNNTLAGSDFPSTFNLYPIPSKIVVQANYKQNPGY